MSLFLRFFLLSLFFPLFFCSSADKSYTPCEERCRYMHQDCINHCGPGGFSFTIVYGSGATAGIKSCHERCDDLFHDCMRGCNPEKPSD